MQALTTEQILDLQSLANPEDGTGIPCWYKEGGHPQPGMMNIEESFKMKGVEGVRSSAPLLRADGTYDGTVTGILSMTCIDHELLVDQPYHLIKAGSAKHLEMLLGYSKLENGFVT